jgi:RNA polymerase sigma factor (sigma-70 family)
MVASPAPREQRSRELFFELVGPHLTRLHHLVRHLLRYREATGDLRAGEVAPEELVDAVVVRAYREFVRHPPPGRPLKRWLVGLAREEVARELRRRKSWDARTPVHTEDDVPETPPEEAVSRLGEEILEFYEPEEDLRVEDVVPDLDLVGPEEQAESDELRWSVDAALAGLPREWREIVLLHHVEGLSGAELARVAGKSTDEVEHVLELAREYLRQRLVESGRALAAERHDRRAGAGLRRGPTDT